MPRLPTLADLTSERHRILAIRGGGNAQKPMKVPAMRPVQHEGEDLR
jgi:hypothetical protein